MMTPEPASEAIVGKTGRRIGAKVCSLVAIILLTGEVLAVQAVRTRPPRLSIESEPATIVVGAPFLLRVDSTKPLESLEGSWLGHELFFEFDRQSGRWYGLSGVGLDTAPGNHRLVLTAKTAGGVDISVEETLAVERTLYRSSALSVSRRFTEPDVATTARIAEEQALKKQLFAQVSPARQWEGAFVAPLESVITETFGTQRTFNGEVQSVHQGLDYRASSGTPIRVINSGTVILARQLFFEGNCIVIDHGQGFLSLYFHLSGLGVKEGDRVQRAQAIGLSGATGRVTAPHLHVAIRWQGTYLDPARLLKLVIP